MWCQVAELNVGYVHLLRLPFTSLAERCADRLKQLMPIGIFQDIASGSRTCSLQTVILTLVCAHQ